MESCGRYQAEMLEYLYDLPDEDERRAFQEHLDRCPTCPALLRQAREQQRLLAAAARMTFPEVRFEDPADVASKEQRVLPMQRKGVTTRWLPWAIAAGVLLAAGGVSVPILRGWKSGGNQLGELDAKENEGITPKDQADGGASTKQEPRRFVPASVKQVSAWVELLAVNPQSRTIEVRTRQGESRKLSVGVHAQVVLRGAVASLADLRPGQSVLLSLEENSKGQWSNLKKVEDEATAKTAGKP